jgi:ubiquinone/menaquinone biosynthesis C-methylase UbiE
MESMMRSDSYVKENEKVWDVRSENSDRWSIPVSSEEIEQAKRGNWAIWLTPKKLVPASWFPKDISGKKILCLASGGGQQGPVLAAAGADVTVFDNSTRQLEKDEFVAKRDHLQIKTVKGTMQDLSMFEDESFDCIVHPWSNGYVDNVLPVWKECARVLKKNGLLLAGFANPIEYIFDLGKFEQGILELKHSIPYADIEHMDDEHVRSVVEVDGYIWAHSLEDQIQGQIDAGFAIVGFYEDCGGSILDSYISTSIATKAIKVQ